MTRTVSQMIADLRASGPERNIPGTPAARWRSGVSKVAVCVLLIWTAGCGIKSSSASSPSAVDLLKRMVAAEKSTEYEGMRDLVRFLGTGERRSFFFVQHHANGPTLVESAGRQGGPSRQWVERFGRLYWLADKQLLLQNYVVAENGRRMVSGRDGRVLEITSRHEGRPSIEIVVDAGCGLLLATEFRDYRGQVSHRSEFRTLLLHPGLGAPPAEKQSERKWRNWDVEQLKDKKGAVSFGVLEPRYLPEGFVRKSRWRSRRSDRVNTMYSDGLTWIQISLSPAEPGRAERVVKQVRSGARTTMNMNLNGVAVHLVGQVDPAVLLDVLGSLKEEADS